MVIMKHIIAALYVTKKPPSIVYVIFLLWSHRAPTRSVIITAQVPGSDCHFEML